MVPAQVQELSDGNVAQVRLRAAGWGLAAPNGLEGVGLSAAANKGLGGAALGGVGN
jgi:hypothetical protein